MGAEGSEENIPEERLNTAYSHLLTLWTAGVRDYHTMLSRLSHRQSDLCRGHRSADLEGIGCLDLQGPHPLAGCDWDSCELADGDCARPLVRSECALGMATAWY